MVQTTVALRIDVDTRRGLVEGVPRLLGTLGSAGIRASFFVTMGPDRSGLAIRRAWRPSFVLKMLRSRALRLYGLRTALSGTLLPARPVGAGSPALLRQIAAEGHEVGIHGWDHVSWQDRVHRLPERTVLGHLHAAASAFETALGRRPAATAAPGWRTTDAALQLQERFGFAYASDVRGTRPFRPWIGGAAAKTVQIPTTLPTMDELLGRVPDVATAMAAALREGLNVLTAHAEVEGGAQVADFERLLGALGRRGAVLCCLADVADAARLEAEAGPPVAVGHGEVRGRSGWVAVQDTPRAAVSP